MRLHRSASRPAGAVVTNRTAGFQVRVFNSLDDLYEGSYDVSIALDGIFGSFPKSLISTGVIGREIALPKNPSVSKRFPNDAETTPFVDLRAGTTDTIGKFQRGPLGFVGSEGFHVTHRTARHENGNRERAQKIWIGVAEKRHRSRPPRPLNDNAVPSHDRDTLHPEWPGQHSKSLSAQSLQPDTAGIPLHRVFPRWQFGCVGFYSPRTRNRHDNGP